MKVLKIYKELRDVAICEDDNGQMIIKAMYTDEGSEEERKVVEMSVMSEGFKPTSTDIINPSK